MMSGTYDKLMISGTCDKLMISGTCDKLMISAIYKESCDKLTTTAEVSSRNSNIITENQTKLFDAKLP